MPKKKTPVKSRRVAFTAIRDPFNMKVIDIYTHGGCWRPTPGTMPSEVKVYGQLYKIFYHTRIYHAPDRDRRLAGCCLYANRIIILDPDQTFPEMRETLYHEIAHIYLSVWQTKSESLAKLTPQQVEHVCDLFGEAIPDLVGNNSITV